MVLPFDFLFEFSYRKPAFLIFPPSFIELEESIGGPPVMHCMKEPFFVWLFFCLRSNEYERKINQTKQKNRPWMNKLGTSGRSLRTDNNLVPCYSKSNGQSSLPTSYHSCEGHKGSGSNCLERPNRTCWSSNARDRIIAILPHSSSAVILFLGPSLAFHFLF